MKTFYLAAAILGTLLPWSTFFPFLLNTGLNPASILSALYANGASAGLSTDFFISCVVFWAIVLKDAQGRSIPSRWIVMACAPVIGLSMAFPTYLYLRERSASA